MHKVIIGAGLAGLIAGCHFKDAEIYEAGPPVDNHKALLRFRDKSVSDITGIPFREVEVRKAIYTSADHTLRGQCDIKLANLYALKVTGQLLGRSIWNLDAVRRYIAPEDFHTRLMEKFGNRLRYNCPIGQIEKGQTAFNYISTAPLPIMAKIAQGFPMAEALTAKTTRAAIKVERYRIPGADVYQTIYFPEPDLRVFRASISGDVLIVESVDKGMPDQFSRLSHNQELIKAIKPAFGLEDVVIEFEEAVEQKYGKIVDLPKELRQAALYELTRDYRVYSLGRFATWRNILLDDVAKDIQVIDGLMKASDYGRFLAVGNEEIPF